MLVSVLINNYNYSKFIDQCIESVLAQTYKNIEIIVYDDGSTDSSLQVLDKYKDRITIIVEENYGHTPNRNQANGIFQAFLRSSGQIVCLLDSDDAFCNKKIEKVVKAFSEDKSVCVVQNLLQEIDSNDKKLGNVRPVLKEIKDTKSYIYQNNSLSHIFVSTSGLSFRRKFLQKVLPLNEDNRSYIWPDTRLMIHSVFHGNIISLREPLTYYRIHDTNDSNVRGTLEGHEQYIDQLVHYFNEIAERHSYPRIVNDRQSYLENTFFYSAIDREKLFSFIRQIPETEEVWIWGAGEAGQSIGHALSKNQQNFKGFIDSDPRKQNQVIEGKHIYSPERLYYDKNIRIIVSPFHAYDAIKSNLEINNLNEGFQFIDPYIRKD